MECPINVGYFHPHFIDKDGASERLTVGQADVQTYIFWLQLQSSSPAHLILLNCCVHVWVVNNFLFSRFSFRLPCLFFKYVTHGLHPHGLINISNINKNHISWKRFKRWNKINFPILSSQFSLSLNKWLNSSHLRIYPHTFKKIYL